MGGWEKSEDKTIVGELEEEEEGVGGGVVGRSPGPYNKLPPGR